MQLARRRHAIVSFASARLLAGLSLAVASIACRETVLEPTKGPSPNVAPAYAIAAGATGRDLGTLGGPNSQATGVNDNGQVVGWSVDAAGNDRAFIWTDAGGMQDLGVGTAAGYRYAMAFGINNKGQVVGQYWAQGLRAFIWQPSVGAKSLATPSPWVSALAFSISDNGYVAGTAYAYQWTGLHAALWTSDGQAQDLGTLPGKINANATGVNQSGSVVGVSYNGAGIATDGRAFLWTAAGGMRDLGTLPGGTWSSARGINDAGQVIGQSSVAGGYTHAFVWSEAGGMRDLGSLTNPNSAGLGVNQSGIALVSASTTGSRVALWSASDGLEDVAGGQPSALNNSWQIVGYVAVGTSGSAHAFLWTVTPHVASVAITPASVSVQVGNTQQLTVTLTDAIGKELTGRVVTWSSSDESIANVDASGSVTGVGVGTATITATSEGKSATASVNVQAAGYMLVFDEGDPTTLDTKIVAQQSDGSNRTILKTYNLGGGGIGSLARWRPKTNQVVYQIANPQQGDLYLLDANNLAAAPLQLTSNSGLNVGAAFTPDGNQIVFTSTRTGKYELWIMNVNGTSQRQLSHTPSEDGGATFSPVTYSDGHLDLAFLRVSTELFGREVWIMTLFPDGTTTERRVTANGGQKSIPRWSADGKQLLFEREGGLYTVDAMAVDAPLESMTQLVTQGHQPLSPDWSADGKKIVFTTYGEWRLYMMNPDGSSLERIPTPDGQQTNYPSFKP